MPWRMKMKGRSQLAEGISRSISITSLITCTTTHYRYVYGALYIIWCALCGQLISNSRGRSLVCVCVWGDDRFRVSSHWTFRAERDKSKRHVGEVDVNSHKSIASCHRSMISGRSYYVWLMSCVCLKRRKITKTITVHWRATEPSSYNLQRIAT